MSYEEVVSILDAEYGWGVCESAAPDQPTVEEALAAGFKLGSTSKVTTGHYSTIPTGWETHHEWLKANQLVEKFGVDANGAPINPEAYAVANGVNGKHEPVVSV